MSRNVGWSIRLGFAIAALVGLSWSQAAEAANIVWNGGTGVWSTGTNWVGGVAPGSADTATFSGSTTACSIGSSVSVAGISISVGVTITQASGVTVTTSGAFTQSAGTFNGGNSPITIGGAFNLSVGTFKSTSGLLQVIGAYNKTGGTFNANGGQVMLSSTSSQTFATNGATFNNLTISDGLVGYWKLDEATGTAIADASGNGNDGTLQGGSTWVTSSSSLPSLNFTDNAAVSLNGSGEYATLGINNLPAINGAMTIAFWTYYASVPSGSQNAVVLKQSASSGVQIGFFGSGLKAVKSGGTTLVAATTTPASGWHHVAYTFDGTTHSIYVDGGTPATSTVAANTGATTTAWFGSYDGAHQFYNGYLDDVRIYNRALAASEIGSLALGNQPGTSLATQTMTGAPTISGDLVIGSGTLAAGTNAITVGGSWWNYGGLFSGTGNVAFNGTGTTSSIRSAGQDFASLSVTGTGTWTLADRLSVSGGTLSVASGTLNASTYTVRAGAVSASGGTFTATNATVIVDGAANTTLPATTASTFRMEDPTETGLVGYWKLDNGQGTAFRDYSGNGNTGTLFGGTSWVTSSLPSIAYDDPAAISLDGVNDYATLGVNNLPALNGNMTISFWVYYASVSATAGTSQNMIVLSNSTGLLGISLFHDQVINVGNSGGTANLNATTTPASGWHHIAYTYDGTTRKLYVDGGTPATSTTAPQSGAVTNAFLGTYKAGTNELLNGELDDVRIYNTALTAAQVAVLAAGRYPGLGGTSTLTFAGALVAGGTFAIDSGSVATGAYSLTAGNTDATALSTVSAGTLTVGSNTAAVKGGIDFFSNAALTMATSGGTLSIGSGKTLTMDGTLNASSTGATIQSVSGNYAFTVGSTASATPTLNISGLNVKNTDTNGMWIGATTAATTTFTHFDKVAFSSGTGTQLLQINAKALYLSSSGCTFDSGVAATTTYSVALAGNGTADGETRAVFGGSTCASNDSSCQASKKDDDPTNVGVGNNPGTNGAVVQFVRAADDDTAGSIVGFPTAAFDWNTFTYYSTYVTFHDASGTSDVVYVRDETGTALYSWTVPTAGEAIIGTPHWNTVSSKHYLYVATTAGHVYRLLDNGTTSLTLDGSGAWATNPYNCACTITTPLAMDASNLYWGGTASGQKLWTLGQAAESVPTGSPFSITPTITSASPALWTSGSAYLFLGLTGHVLKINVSNQTLTADNTSPGSASVWGRISVGTSPSSTTRVYAADDGGTMWAIDPNNFTSTNKLWSYHTANAIMGSSYYDYYTDTVQYGTQGGTVIVLNGSGAVLNAGYPYTPGAAGDAITAAPLYYSGVLAVGSTGGKLYFIDRNNGASAAALIREYYFGPTESVSGVGFDSNVNRYMVTTANSSTNDGRLYYIDLIADPTPGSS